jgi:hypothetical protein
MDVPRNSSPSKLARDHEESGRLYPRPRSICDDCKGDIVLKWGKEKRPHWAHLPNFLISCKKANGESNDHKLAKELLVLYLSGGGKCNFTHSCNDSILQIPKTAIKFEQEVTFKDSRFDVAGLNEHGEAVLDIEVLFTHKTSNVKDRNTIFWVEVKACDIIEKLDKSVTPSSITLTDEGTKPCCSHLIAKSLEKLNPVVAIKLAGRLGYRETTNLGSQYRELAMKGKTTLCTTWHTTGNTCSCHKNTCLVCSAWKEFLRFRQCIKCLKNHETTYCKPYCTACYVRCRNGNFDMQIQKTISMDKKQELRKELSWIAYVPDVKGDKSDPYLKGNECFFCKDAQIERNQHDNGNSFERFTWWFGKDKRLCSNCLASEYKRRRKL